VHSGGYTGNGVKVALLDMAFDVNNDEIRNNVKNTKLFRHSFDGGLVDVEGYGYEAVHGTAVAEIITDVAPDVELYLYTIGTEIEFQNAIDDILRSSVDIDIVTMSAGWVNHLTNGQSPVTQKLSEVASQIPTIISVGNYRLTHWEGSYNQFSSNVGSLSIPVEQNREIPIWVFLLWDIPSEDYNMILKDSSGNQVDISTNRQYNGFPHGLETISYEPTSGGQHTVEISFAGTLTPRSTLEIFSTTEKEFNPFTSSGSAAVPTDASNVISVGAVDYRTYSSEDYSSEGPTNNGNSVPKIVGPDGVSTLAYGSEPFLGTSAAAPHVAGLVALLLEKDPSLSRQQVVDQVLNNADKNSVGLSGTFDNIVGYGIADASFIISSETISDSGNTSPQSSQSTGPDQSSELLLSETSSPPTITEVEVPGWIKEQTKWWVNDAISDREFVDGIEYMIKKEIIVIPELPESTSTTNQGIPSWIKENARWWVDNKITDTDFAKGLEYLVKEGIITLN